MILLAALLGLDHEGALLARQRAELAVATAVPGLDGQRIALLQRIAHPFREREPRQDP
jgi:hypothetical protein